MAPFVSFLGKSLISIDCGQIGDGDSLSYYWSLADVNSIHRLVPVVGDQQGRWDVGMREALDTLLKIYVWAQDPRSATIEAAMSAWDDANTEANAQSITAKTDLPQSVTQAAIGMVSAVMADGHSAKQLFENVYKLLHSLHQHYSSLDKDVVTILDGQTAATLQFSTPRAIQDDELLLETPGIICCALRDFMHQYFRFWYECSAAGRRDVLSPEITWASLANNVWDLDEAYPTGIHRLDRTRLDDTNPFKRMDVYAFTRLGAQVTSLEDAHKYATGEQVWETIEAGASQPGEAQAICQLLVNTKFLVLLQ